MSGFLDVFPSDSIVDKLKEDAFVEIMTTYNDFISEASNDNPTFALWSDYLEVVEILLCFIR